MSELSKSIGKTQAAQLVTLLADYWPAVFARLGERAGAYVEAAAQKAASHQIFGNTGVARFVNLCCAFGPNFEDKSENEWALALLADERLGEWVKVHQLVVRSGEALNRRSAEGQVTLKALAQADTALLDAADSLHKSNDPDARNLPRVACDIEAFEIRMLNFEWRRQYQNVGGVWQFVEVPAIEASLRLGNNPSLPQQISILTRPSSGEPSAGIQVRMVMHAQCDHDHHPRLSHVGTHGLSHWNGHLAKSVSWPVTMPAGAVAGQSSEIILVEEVFPDAGLLLATSCGLRDQGIPIGSLQTRLCAYSAVQSFFTMTRKPNQEVSWPKIREVAAEFENEPTLCRFERDGVAVPTKNWVQGFQSSLQHHLSLGFGNLFSAWQARAENPAMRTAVSLLAGQTALTWGWREGEKGIASKPVLRLLVELDVRNLILVELTGEIALANTRSRVKLKIQGEIPMKHSVIREKETPGLIDVLLPLTERWQMKFEIEFEPFGSEAASMWHCVGAVSGTLNGEIGLRPKLTGSGWQWFARMNTEALSAPVVVHDPVLGQTQQTVQFLPAATLLDWSFG